MKVLGLTSVKIASLALPGDMKERMANPEVIALAESMETVGQLNEPFVRRLHGNLTLVAGGDRVAAHMLRGLKDVQVKLVECDDQEAKKIELIENAHRRHSPKKRAELMEELVALESAAVRAESPPPASTTKTGKPRKARKAVKTEARARVAEQTGVQPETVRKNEQRARKRREAAQLAEQVEQPETETAAPAENDLAAKLEQISPTRPPAAAPKPPPAPPVIDTMGFDVDTKDVLRWMRVHGELSMVSTKIAQAQVLLTNMRKNGDAIDSAKLQALHAATHELGVRVRSFLPAMLCPYCKGQDGYQGNCQLCLGQGYAAAGQLGNVPKELLDTDNLCVMSNGKLVSLDATPEEPETEYDGDSNEISDDDAFGDL